MKDKLLLEEYTSTVRKRLARTKVWQALTYLDLVAPHIMRCYYDIMTEKQCVKSLRRLIRKANEVVFLAVEAGMPRAEVIQTFADIIFHLEADREVPKVVDMVLDKYNK